MKLPWANNTMKKGKTIVKYFKSHQVPSAILKRYQNSNYDKKISLKLPLAIELTITELSRNQTIRIDDDVKSIVLNDEFWKDVDNLLKVLNELVIGISIFESDTPCLSKVVDWYYNQLESSGGKEKNGVFVNKLAWETAGKVDPITWWCGNFSYSAPELTQVAKKVLSIPTSSAASERNWSAFAYIHDKKRNWLRADCVLKLVYIFNRENIDGRSIDEIQTPDENVESDYEDECSSNESEEESFNDNETDDSDISS
uniref:HAT C-terminal dimerisation domain-containing protein n=1 Tax=Rhizophagus irregularis (strain DAOM 181602 / DAOM 197198 / MUCL 43194) TaxID=747089 RepID=U9TDT1_RHIID